MKLQGLLRTGVAVITLAGITLATVAPADDAHGRGEGRDRRYKSAEHRSHRGDVHGTSVSRAVEIRHTSNAGPVIAGIIGGIALGAVLSSQSHAAVVAYDGRVDDGCAAGYRDGYHGGAPGGVRVAFFYVDPYSGARFASFDACSAYLRGCDHPWVIQRIDVRSGRCDATYRYRHGRWIDHDGDWD